MVRSGGFALALVGTLAAGSLAQAAQSSPAGKTSGPPAASVPSPSRATDSPATNGAGSAPTAISQDAAARARMHECGHQWSSIKKAGNAGTMTWKEFSATCLVSR